MMKRIYGIALTALIAQLGLQSCTSAPVQTTVPTPASWATASWVKQTTEPYKGKQDDIVFINADTGWYGNGQGHVYHTTDGGQQWKSIAHMPGTFVRALGFMDERNGFLGNVGTDYFPGVTDTQPLYRTHDGGASWSPVTNVQGPVVKGICAIDIVKRSFIDAGVLRERTIVHAAGRVGGPAFLMRSLDGGESWKTMDLSAHTAMILDVKFFDEMHGVIAGASDADTAKSHARIIATRDGGVTWKTVYESIRPYEITWKLSFPTREVGYSTIQKYNPDKSVTQHYVAKTSDGGNTWREVAVAQDAEDREFGVGFISLQAGFVGTLKGGYRTSDGGATWQFVEMGRAVNKIRFVTPGSPKQGMSDSDKTVGYAIGVEIRKLELP